MPKPACVPDIDADQRAYVDLLLYKHGEMRVFRKHICELVPFRADAGHVVECIKIHRLITCPFDSQSLLRFVFGGFAYGEP